MPRFTINDLKNSKVANLNSNVFQVKHATKKLRKVRKDCKQVLWIKDKLGWWCGEKGYTLLFEYKFHPYRKFKFDCAILELKIAIEYEGIICDKSGHTTALGFTNNAIKYNLAQTEGWQVLRFTTVEQHYKTVVAVLEENLKQRSNEP